MVKVKPRAAREAAYRQAIGSVPAKYKAGIEGTSDWKASALAGQGLYEERMRDSAILARRRKGIESVSDQEWKTRASQVGSQRIAMGMEAGAAKQAQNWQPIADALEAVQLPARTADAVQNVTNRVIPIVLAAQQASKKNS